MSDFFERGLMVPTTDLPGWRTKRSPQDIISGNHIEDLAHSRYCAKILCGVQMPEDHQQHFLWQVESRCCFFFFPKEAQHSVLVDDPVNNRWCTLGAFHLFSFEKEAEVDSFGHFSLSLQVVH